MTLSELAAALRDFVPLLAVLAGAALVLSTAHALLIARRRQRGLSLAFGRPLVMLVLAALAVLAAILALPVGEITRGQLFSLLGLVLTAILTLASTSLVANAMAGLMLRAVGNFRVGDFVRVGEVFGRVSERGLFHTEVQTEDRDLATLPNLHLATNPVTVVRASGTVVSAHVSLGYDVHHGRVEELLIQAAADTGLEEPFVQILERDSSVLYRAAGFLPDVKRLISARSSLRSAMLDALHDAGVEIVSPQFMNQRQLPTEAPVVPAKARRRTARSPERGPESVMFDKAEQAAAAEREALNVRRAELSEQLARLEADARVMRDAEQRARLETEIAERRAQIQDLGLAEPPDEDASA